MSGFRLNLGGFSINTGALGSLASSAGGMQVSRPSRVNIDRARTDARMVRPIVPYKAPVPYTGGRVRALLIGINYRGSAAELKGCVNDVYQMMGTLQKIAFPISECCILVDDQNFPNFTAMPTRDNIIKYMCWLTNDVRPGDVLFLHYSGHGGQTKAQNDSQEAYDQTLMPLDYKTRGAILDDDLFDILVKPLPSGARMTCVFDCCHSATMLDMPFSFVGGANISANLKNAHMKQVRNDNFSQGDVVMFSGCDDAGTSADVRTGGSGGAGGAATQAFTWALTNTAGYHFMGILLKTRDILRDKKFKQVPQLTSSKPLDLYKPFSLFGPLTVDSQMMAAVPQQYQMAPPAQPQYNFALPTPMPQQQPSGPYAFTGAFNPAPPPGQYQQNTHPPQGYPPAQYNPQPPQQPGYPPQQPGYPPQQPGYPPQQPGYPPQQPGYPPQQPGYPPQQPGYPPQQPGYPPQQPGYPPQTRTLVDNNFRY